jgi:L-seryl-tRNA(Ser) seleniumtransferase
MELRDLPSVDALLNRPEITERIADCGRPLALQAAREVLARVRREVQAGGPVPGPDDLTRRILDFIDRTMEPSIRRVVNAAGVILHTNLGRAPVSRACRAAMDRAAAGYVDLEYDRAKGERGGRAPYIAELLRMLTGAEDSLVVNNNAGAVLLALAALAKGREVVISRSQLIEIGGGFRIPDVMRQSGAKLVEIGTTNRTYPGDYAEAITPKTALLLRAHHSNFRLVGFTAEPGIAELAAVGGARGVPVVDDVGSGALLDTSRYGLGREPTVPESIAAGAALVLFSGDKLLGGPQAGILAGRADLIAKIGRHPLARALRADKVRLAGMEATLLHYLRGEAEREIPVWRMIAAGVDDLEKRARSWLERIGDGEAVPARSAVGGGSLPEETLPTCALALRVAKPQAFLAALRAADPPVIARIEEGRVLLDPRTVAPEEEEDLVAAVRAALR